MTTALLVGLGVLALASWVRRGHQLKQAGDARRRESMRRVAESWHFREWEQSLRSRDAT